MEQELAAGLGEGQIAQFIQDQEVEAGDQVGGSALAFCAGFGVELVDQIDDVEEPPAPAVSDAGPGDADGEMGLAGSGQANDRLPAFRDLRFGFVIRFILGRDRWCRWSRDRVVVEPRI